VHQYKGEYNTRKNFDAVGGGLFDYVSGVACSQCQAPTKNVPHVPVNQILDNLMRW